MPSVAPVTMACNERVRTSEADPQQACAEANPPKIHFFSDPLQVSGGRYKLHRGGTPATELLPQLQKAAVHAPLCCSLMKKWISLLRSAYLTT